MPKTKSTVSPSACAGLVGFALVFVVLLSQGWGLLSGWALGRAFPATGEEAVAIPEWASGISRLLMSVVVFLPPFLFLRGAYGGRAVRVSLARGPVPLRVLLPLFLGLMVAVNSLSGLLRSLIAWLAGFPQATAGAFPQTAAGRILYFLSACVAAPLLEELLFRGAIQGLLRGWGRRVAIVVASLLFTLLHTTVWELPAIFVLSLMLGYIAEISGSVRPCIALHFFNNLFSYGLSLAQQTMEGLAALALLVWVILLLGGLFAAAVWAIRRFRLGPRLLLPREDSPLPGKKRLAGLLRSPIFATGALVVAAYFVLRLVAG